MEQNQNHPRHRHRDQHSHPSVTLRPRPAAAAAAAAAATASNTIDQLNITIGHHTSNYNGFFQYNNYYDNDDDDDDPPPEDWPLGPQGAPIPSHLLLLHHTLSDSPLMGDGTRHRHHHHHHHHNSYHHGSTFLDEDADAGAEGGESNREDNALSTTAIQRAPSIAGAAEASASAASTSNANNIMDSMPPFLPSTLTSPSSPSPPFGQRRQQQRPDDTTNNNNSGWGWRERRFHHHQHQQQNHHRQLSQHQQPQTFSPTPPPSVAVYINAVKFLDHAVTRLENKLSSTQSSSSSSSSSSGNSNANNTANPNITTPQQPQNIEELESKLLIRLVEIMLHPPTTTMCTPTTVMTDDNSSNGWEHNEYDCSCHEDDGNEESSSGGTLDDGDDLEVDDDDDDDEDVMTMTGASSSGETNSSELRTILTIPATFVPNNKSSPAMSPLNQQPHYPTIASAKLAIQQLGQMIPQRRVCQYAFKRNDIVWVCRTCQSDETCVLCHECFRNSNHEGHDVAFYHAQAGGCCDCGDEDAWSPKGFCGRHGGPATTSNNCLGNDDVENPTKLMLNNVEPAVLGAVCAIADYLAVVVRSGVEGGYRRANPSSLFHGATTSASPFGAEMTATIADDILPHITAPRGSSSDDTLLPEYYDEDDGGRDRRHQRDFRRDHSFHRRSTVADMESVSAAPLPMLHEAQFNPSLASTSSSASQRRSSNQSSKEVDMIDTPTFNKVFDPNAAGSSSSSSSSSKFTSTTPNCGAAKMVCDGAHLEPDNATQYETSEVRSPARALGDLGREEHGLFLVLHCDEIHMGPPSSSSSHHYSSNSRSEVIAALKELYSAPGGGGKVGDAASVSAGIYHFTDIGRGGGDGGTHSFGPTNRFTRQPDRLLLSPTRYSLFRAPQAEAILDRIVQIVKSQGDLIVWGTQEILAECGMLVFVYLCLVVN